MHWPDVDPSDTRWESKLLRFMSPPQQTADSRKRFYFSLFYTVTSVFALLNLVVYWTLQVPHGHSHWPGGDGGDGGDGGGDDGGDDGFFVIFDGESKFPPVKDIFSDGWFPAFSIFNQYATPALATVIESLFLNSMRRQEVSLLSSCSKKSIANSRVATACSQPLVRDPDRRRIVPRLCWDRQGCHGSQCLLVVGRGTRRQQRKSRWILHCLCVPRCRQ